MTCVYSYPCIYIIASSYQEGREPQGTAPSVPAIIGGNEWMTLSLHQFYSFVIAMKLQDKCTILVSFPIISVAAKDCCFLHQYVFSYLLIFLNYYFHTSRGLCIKIPSAETLLAKLIIREIGINNYHTVCPAALLPANCVYVMCTNQPDTDLTVFTVLVFSG